MILDFIFEKIVTFLFDGVENIISLIPHAFIAKIDLKSLAEIIVTGRYLLPDGFFTQLIVCVVFYHSYGLIVSVAKSVASMIFNR